MMMVELGYHVVRLGGVIMWCSKVGYDVVGYDVVR